MPINEIDGLKNSFVEDLLPRRIYLFGFFAEGNQNEDSDFDFYIVVDDSQKDVLALTAKAYKSIRHKQKRAVDIIVNTEKTFGDRKKKDNCLWKTKSQRRECCYMEHEELMWLAFAKTDLGVAQHLNESYYPKPLEIICYHCEQAAEKAIKALIAFCSGGIERP